MLCCHWDSLCHSILKKKPNAAVCCLHKWTVGFLNGLLDCNRIENIAHHYWCWPVDLHFFLHNILALFVRLFKFTLLNATEWRFSSRMRLGKTYLFWRQFSAYGTEIGCGPLALGKLFLLYIHLNLFDMTDQLLDSVLRSQPLATLHRGDFTTVETSSTKQVAAVSAASNFSLHSTCPSSGRNTVPWTEYFAAFIHRKTQP